MSFREIVQQDCQTKSQGFFAVFCHLPEPCYNIPNQRTLKTQTSDTQSLDVAYFVSPALIYFRYSFSWSFQSSGIFLAGYYY